MKKNFLGYLCTVIILFISSNSLSENKNEVRIIMKINEQIITNIDIKNEYNYLLALNNNLASLTKSEGYKIAKDSLVREIIKSDEIAKYVDLKNFNDENLMKNVLNNLTFALKLNSILELENYLNTYNISIENVKNKMATEVLWNQLIFSKYKNKLNIDEKKLNNQIENSGFLEQNNEIQYELSEILYEVKNKDEFNDLTNLIINNIQTIGFKNTANKFSISETSKLGGYLGTLNETQLSKEIRQLLSTINIGDFTKPIKVGTNFLILYINDKKLIKRNIDKKVLLNNLIEAERQKQLNNFSQIYYNKIKINNLINEF
ncbi:peptidylprolyl isomerase [Candidatus Pelagibacter sp.]|nr:peptidylprolyl isomerase [Candidatus Pelagibacter sp.]